MIYRYYTRLRPPAPGAIPKGAVNVESFDCRCYVPEVKVMAWGYADYSTPLPDRMVKDYDLSEALLIGAVPDQ